MALDTKKIKERLNSLQERGKGGFEKTDLTKIFWKPKTGEQVIRIVPSKYSKEYPFQEVKFHKGIGKKSILSLTNFGEKDPIVEFINQLKKIDKEKVDQELLKKLYPKTRIYAQVIVRNEEDKGTRLWEFGPQTYQDLLSILDNDDYGDITDIADGIDLTVKGVDDVFNKVKYVKISSITPKRKNTPLSSDNELLKKLLDEQYNPLELPFNKKYSFDEIKGFLEAFLNDGDDDQAPFVESNEGQEGKTEIPHIELNAEDDGDDEDKSPEVAQPVVKTKTKTELKKGKKETTTKDKFDKLFENQ